MILKSLSTINATVCLHRITLAALTFVPRFVMINRYYSYPSNLDDGYRSVGTYISRSPISITNVSDGSFLPTNQISTPAG